MRDEVFLLHPSCLPVAGHAAGLICDLQRGQYVQVPKTMVEVLQDHPQPTWQELLDDYADEDILKAYFDFLVAKEYGFWTTSPECFPTKNGTWDHPALITNAIIDHGVESQHDYPSLLRQLDALGCEQLELRFFTAISEALLDDILQPAQTTDILGIQLLLQASSATSAGWLATLCEKYPRVNSITLAGATEDGMTMIGRRERPEHLLAHLISTTQVLDSHTHCGVVHPDYFSVNRTAANEALTYNSCLNRKLGIDEQGYIRNCPSMPQQFGHHREVKLAEAIAIQEFQKVWGITKDQVSVCRDCEFRYICTDCRAHRVEESDPLAKPAGCSYDPYTATWAP
ncbi:MAG TPA: grasp-with-spasm system SPASM domain peptide maturase [Cytophagales bacterium]|nr:grasp-with-spasm system SPASM domain peptide maturase [Cytophagales bacterium]HAA23282.1 grasp-with-spasm system SPASM domain peptide maturase [Cytophagales bacterium]HAP61852.1 grasp-with-spasm system SPASM domain peptide maturase [Cytophagales bacterium]